MHTILQLLSIIASYLIGAVPFGMVFGKLSSGVDVRTVGSGNIGATNVLRAAGKKAALLTLLADCAKGLLPVLAIQAAFQDDYLTAFAGIAAVLGHNFPVYLGFKGGKGVAVSFGVVLAVSPWIGLVCLLTWLAAAIVWRFSSLAALISFGVYPVLTLVAHTGSKPFGLLSLFIFGTIYFRHRENIKRLLAGVEPKIGEK